MTAKNVKGFSLVELMIVMVILGIMVTIAIPSLDFVFSKDKLRKSTSTVTASLYTARMKAVNDAEPYGVQFNTNGDFYLIRDPEGDNEIRGATNHLEDGISFSTITFQNDLVIFNEFGQLKKSCLPSGVYTGQIMVTNGSVDSTMIEITFLTGRIRETNL
ncbi:prepilin-type N-terminal cleavage/methylation domain-containing protein [bacterium]|nr:prepilin-type N-terminal cleavage/methylation domain-containing protein [bacterium]